ncbi:MAG: agmatine deiminase family protein [Desulfobacterales bacterium]|nr:agmatine deiminase family protein [Desulfobacterales bacterium]
MKKIIKNCLIIFYLVVFGLIGFSPWNQSCSQAEAKNSVPGKSTFYLPGEFEEHDAVWMGWPTYENKAGWSVKDLHVQLWAAMAPHVYVNVAINPDNVKKGWKYDVQIAEIKALMKKYNVPENRVRFRKIEHEDVWWRDMGPIYLIDGKGNRAVVDFGFNGWGYESNDSDYSRKEGSIDAQIARLEGIKKIYKTHMISEGGDREFNGKGVLIVVEAVEKQRNPGMTLAQMESEFKKNLGVMKIIWLKKGRYDDEQTFSGCLPNKEGKKELYTVIATGGHIDEHVRFVSPNRILYTEVSEEEAHNDPIAAENKKRFDENLKILKSATDQDGKTFELIPMPSAPTIVETLQPGDGVYDYLTTNNNMKKFNKIPDGKPIKVVMASSYLNFLITNEVVLAQKFWQEGRPQEWRKLDEQAMKILQAQFPDRKVIAFNAKAINIGGGGIHCNTQQVPKAKR